MRAKYLYTTIILKQLFFTRNVCNDLPNLLNKKNLFDSFLCCSCLWIQKMGSVLQSVLLGLLVLTWSAAGQSSRKYFSKHIIAGTQQIRCFQGS